MKHDKETQTPSFEEILAQSAKRAVEQEMARFRYDAQRAAQMSPGMAEAYSNLFGSTSPGSPPSYTQQHRSTLQRSPGVPNLLALGK